VSDFSSTQRPQATRVYQTLVVAAYPSVRAGLTALLARDPEIDVVESELGTVAATENDLDAIVIDASSGPNAIENIQELYPAVPLVLIGADAVSEGPDATSGAVAYLSADVDAAALATAVKAVAQGLTVLDPELMAAAGMHLHSHPQPATPIAGEALTAREREVLELVAAGLPNKAIARELGISEHTAKFHVGSLLAKLGAASRTEAVTIATRRGILAI
jgi:two-component system nitrate/nitrite response regulator NarL